MRDRVRNCTSMLDNLDVEAEKILKCNGHVILGVENVADIVFKQIEQGIGVEKLVDV